MSGASLLLKGRTRAFPLLLSLPSPPPGVPPPGGKGEAEPCTMPAAGPPVTEPPRESAVAAGRGDRCSRPFLALSAVHQPLPARLHPFTLPPLPCAAGAALAASHHRQESSFLRHPTARSCFCGQAAFPGVTSSLTAQERGCLWSALADTGDGSGRAPYNSAVAERK